MVVVIVEPGRERLTRELLGEAAGLAARGGGRVVAVGPDLPSDRDLSCWGADEAFQVVGPGWRRMSPGHRRMGQRS